MILQEYSIITNIIVQNMQLFSDYELFDRYNKGNWLCNDANTGVDHFDRAWFGLEGPRVC